MLTNKLTDNDAIDIFETFADALEILLEPEEDEMTFSEFSVKPPEYMVRAAKRGLELREKQTDSNKCCTDTGIARARQISNKSNLSISTIKRIKSFAARHSNDLSGAEKDSKKVQALLMWGVPATKSGVDRVIAWADRQIKRYESKKNK